MERSRKILIAKFATVFAVVPAVVVALGSGAPPRHTGAPGEQTCAECHTGTAVNSSNGNVAITYSGGTNYTPGQRGRFTVSISDIGGGRSAFGFQTVAKTSDNAQAGEFVAGQGTRIVCEDDRTPPCREGALLQYITHSQPNGTGTFEFEWTPPATASGDIRVYVAGNAANGNRQNTGDRIYSASITLTPGSTQQPNRPSISSGGVADAFNFREGVAENSWVALFGTNLATETRTWDGTAELGQGRLPTTLGGVSVTIDGKAAPVYAISPTQVNVLTPMGVGTGNIQVVLRNANGETTATAQSTNLLPGLYAPFAQEGRLFVTAVENATGDLLGKPGVDARATRAFRPGDVVQFYANGLGPANPPVGENQFIATPRPLTNTPQIRINDVPVEILGSALVGSGLYQVNGRIPDVPNGDHRISIEIGGAPPSASNVYITIQR